MADGKRAGQRQLNVWVPIADRDYIREEAIRQAAPDRAVGQGDVVHQAVALHRATYGDSPDGGLPDQGETEENGQT